MVWDVGGRGSKIGLRWINLHYTYPSVPSYSASSWSPINRKRRKTTPWVPSRGCQSTGPTNRNAASMPAYHSPPPHSSWGTWHSSQSSRGSGDAQSSQGGTSKGRRPTPGYNIWPILLCCDMGIWISYMIWLNNGEIWAYEYIIWLNNGEIWAYEHMAGHRADMRWAFEHTDRQWEALGIQSYGYVTRLYTGKFGDMKIYG
jgi:hypothetical protein